MNRRTMVLVNPTSGGGATGRAWSSLRRGLASAVGSWDEVFTQRPDHATALARRAVEEGYDQLVVVGGDGTLNEAINGLFPADPEMGIGAEPLRRDLRLGVVRRGTGGDFARYLEIPGRGARVFEHLGSTRSTRLDLGLCTFVDHDGRPRRRAFANVASFGLSGLVDDKINATGKRFGPLSFVGATASALFEYRRRSVRVTVDDQVLHEGPLLLGAAANARYFGGGVQIAPEADPGDGLLDVVLLLNVGPREVVSVLDVYSGRHTRWRSARVARGQVVEATALDERCLLDLDGEQPGVLDGRFELVPSAVELVLP